MLFLVNEFVTKLNEENLLTQALPLKTAAKHQSAGALSPMKFILPPVLAVEISSCDKYVFGLVLGLVSNASSFNRRV